MLHHLIAALETPATIGRTLDLGGPDVWSHARVMREMAAAMGLRRRLVMTARFNPRGLLGIACWCAVLPLHGIVYRGMLRGLVRAAEDTSSQPSTRTSPAVATAPRGGDSAAS